jgi:hypothetical protein
MSTITIDDVVYDENELSEQAKIELGSMQVCDQRIITLQGDLAIASTARNTYAASLNALLPKVTSKKAKAKAKKA